MNGAGIECRIISLLVIMNFVILFINCIFFMVFCVLYEFNI